MSGIRERSLRRQPNSGASGWARDYFGLGSPRVIEFVVTLTF